MASSQKQFDTESKVAGADPITVDVLNIMLEYDDSDKVISHGEAPLVATLFNSIKTKKLTQLKTLLTAIVSGKPDEAKAILEKEPSLLLENLEEKEFVTAPTGHKFNLKPYQAALSVYDTQMAEMVKSYFAELKDENEADRQFDEQCPKGWEDAEEKKWNQIFNQHYKLACAIRDTKEGDITFSDPSHVVTVKEGSIVQTELHKFWNLLDATVNEVITAGKRPFNPNLLLRIWHTYDNDKLFKEYLGGRWNDLRALLFWQKVIGYDGIQRIMPVNYVQAFQDWLEDTAKKLQKGEPQARSTQFEVNRSGNWVSVDFYPLRARASSGFNFAIFGVRRGHWAAGRVWGGPDGAVEAGRSLCQSKTAGLQNLRRSTKKQST